MLNISNRHKAVIWWTEFLQTLKKSLIFVRLNQNRALHNSFDAKLIWNWRLRFILSDVLKGCWGMLFTKIFFLTTIKKESSINCVLAEYN